MSISANIRLLEKRFTRDISAIIDTFLGGFAPWNMTIDANMFAQLLLVYINRNYGKLPHIMIAYHKYARTYTIYDLIDEIVGDEFDLVYHDYHDPDKWNYTCDDEIHMQLYSDNVRKYYMNIVYGRKLLL